MDDIMGLGKRDWGTLFGPVDVPPGDVGDTGAEPGAAAAPSARGAFSPLEAVLAVLRGFPYNVGGRAGRGGVWVRRNGVSLAGLLVFGCFSQPRRCWRGRLVCLAGRVSSWKWKVR